RRAGRGGDRREAARAESAQRPAAAALGAAVAPRAARRPHRLALAPLQGDRVTYRSDEEAARARLAALQDEIARLEADEPSIDARALANRLDRLTARIAEAKAQLPEKDEDPKKVWTRIVIAIWTAFIGFGTIIFALTRC